MLTALHHNGTRVFTPDEVSAIRLQIQDPRLRALFNVMLFTGMRFSEIKQLIEQPDRYRPDRKIIRIKSTKAAAKRKERTIYLNALGARAVEEFLQDPYLVTLSTWKRDMQQWATRAGLAQLAQYEQTRMYAGSEKMIKYNPCGINVKSTRKTWEAWLIAVYSDKLEMVQAVQGHSDTTELEHYMTIGFTRDEQKQIKEIVGDLL